jgi:putative transposase
MLVFEFKTYGKSSQFTAVDEAIRTAQFVRNSCLRYWIDNKKVNKYDLNKYCAVLAHDFPFADELNSIARQASAERAWSAISRFYDNCKKGILGKKGYPKFQKNCRSVEYKSTGWKLAEHPKSINFTDKKGIGRLKLKGTRDLHFYQISQIKRVRLVKRADGVYIQFCIDVDRKENTEPSGNTIGLDVGLKEYYTDSNGTTIENPRFLRKGEKVLKRSAGRVSRRVRGSKNRGKARQIHSIAPSQNKQAAALHHAVKLARCVISSNDVVAVR